MISYFYDAKNDLWRWRNDGTRRGAALTLEECIEHARGEPKRTDISVTVREIETNRLERKP